MKIELQKLIQILDKEIKAYTELKELFAEKRELLKKAKTDDLGVLDNKILALNNSIVKLNKSREKLSEEIIGKNGNMSDFITYAEREVPELAEELKERKVKICNIIPEITLLNNQNVELLKHGIIISN